MQLDLKDGSTLFVTISDDWNDLATLYGAEFVRSVGVAGVRAVLTRMANRQLAGVAAGDLEKRRAVSRYLESWRPVRSKRDDVGAVIGSARFGRLTGLDAEGRTAAARRIADALGVVVRVMGTVEVGVDAVKKEEGS